MGRHLSADVKDTNHHFPPGSACTFQIPQFNFRPQLMTTVSFLLGTLLLGPQGLLFYELWQSGE